MKNLINIIFLVLFSFFQSNSLLAIEFDDVEWSEYWVDFEFNDEMESDSLSLEEAKELKDKMLAIVDSEEGEKIKVVGQRSYKGKTHYSVLCKE